MTGQIADTTSRAPVPRHAVVDPLQWIGRTKPMKDVVTAAPGSGDPLPLPRRMWAGGRLAWHDPLRIGDAATRVSRVEDVSRKSGRTGGLIFVLVGRARSTGRGLALTEEHDIVHRGLPAAGSSAPAPPRARSDEAWCERIVPDEVLLFRYSALTFNAHRIHYDRRYVTELESFPGVIVHGPLIATLLVELLRARMPGATPARFAFRVSRSA